MGRLSAEFVGWTTTVYSIGRSMRDPTGYPTKRINYGPVQGQNTFYGIYFLPWGHSGSHGTSVERPVRRAMERAMVCSWHIHGVANGTSWLMLRESPRITLQDVSWDMSLTIMSVPHGCLMDHPIYGWIAHCIRYTHCMSHRASCWLMYGRTKECRSHRSRDWNRQKIQIVSGFCSPLGRRRGW